jgi:TolA-binding protein
MTRGGWIFAGTALLIFAPSLAAQNAANRPAAPERGGSACADGKTPCQPVAMTDEMTPLENEQADLALNLAHSLAREKKFREALQAYQEFVKVFAMSPRLSEARESMARIYERRQRYDLAIGQYDALYRELGVSALGLGYRLEAARLRELAGDENAAVAIYKELNQIDPGSEAAAKARARMEALHLMQKTGDYVSKEPTATEAKKPADVP